MVLYSRDIMRKNFPIVGGDISAADAARIMVSESSGFLIVNGTEGHYGIVTEWDILSKITARNLDPASVAVKDVMTRDFISVSPDTPTVKLVEIMKEKKIRRLPVVERGKVIGVITSRNILAIFSEYVDNVAEVASKYGNY
ncbi:MAG: CBS domain-containing protein [Candidatus Thermoplasmatota archaeon]|jgi:CBS domain-containing protein|nr:CBS domain-containing protein [Candidatus Thermoplasmatota archaeon]MCL5785697.1 CBS domain-containing protein [Candidatus Thermoplasmatota archaeon]